MLFPVENEPERLPKQHMFFLSPQIMCSVNLDAYSPEALGSSVLLRLVDTFPTEGLGNSLLIRFDIEISEATLLLSPPPARRNKLPFCSVCITLLGCGPPIFPRSTLSQPRFVSDIDPTPYPGFPPLPASVSPPLELSLPFT